MILSTIVLLGVLIFVHELGHFWAAKAVGVGVERFSIGLGPRLWGFTRGGTEYVIAAIPLGGYVKMQGMEDEIMDRVEGGPAETESFRIEGGDYDSKPIWARAIVISAGVIMNMVFAFLIYSGTAAIWGMEEIATTRIMSVDTQALPAGSEALADLPSGARIIQIGDQELETWSDVQRMVAELESGPTTVVTDGPPGVFEVSLGPDESSRRELLGALNVWFDPVVALVEPGTPAHEGGIDVGDRIVAVDGVAIRHWEDVTREVGSRPGARVGVQIERDGATLVRQVELETVTDDETGERIGRLGVSPALPETLSVSVSLGRAISLGWSETVFWSGEILGFLKNLFTGQVSPRSVGSIGTIAQASGDAVENGMPYYLRFMAFFSINLAILNLLPIPILDGGHLVFLAIEAVRGQALSIEQRIRWSQVGLILIVGIMVWALGNDLLRALGL